MDCVQYLLVQGSTERSIIEQAMKTRRPLPKAIADAPQLLLGLEFFWTAFWELSSCRSLGFGAGPIPWSAAADYAITFELEGEDFMDFVYLIRMMDSAWCKHQVEKKPEPANRTK